MQNPIRATSTPSGEREPFVATAGRICFWGALLGVAGGLFTAFVPPQVAEGRFSYPYTPTGFVAIQLVFILNHLALLTGTVGLGSAGAAPGRGGRTGYWISVVGWAMLTMCEVRAITLLNQAYPSPPTELLDAFFGISSILIGVGMLILGVAVVRAGRWTGWQRWIPLACGAGVFLLVIPGIMGPFLIARLAITSWVLIYAALGVALTKRN